MNEKYRGLPNYQALKPKYVQLAEQAHSNEEFLHIVLGYFSLIGASGHGHLLPEESLHAYRREARLQGGVSSDIPAAQFRAAVYWARLYEKTSFSHSLFRVIHRDGAYWTADDWHGKGALIPRGSQIVRVNGMSCSSYREYLRQQTWLRYVAGPVDGIADHLLVINEGNGFRGWKVDFVCPEGVTRQVPVPCANGFPDEGKREFSNWRKRGNCVCLELADDVGYIRVKAMGGAFIKEDGGKIRRFLDRSAGKYRKLIIDVRNNGGGLPYYAYDNLMRPFLDQPLEYKQTTGIKRKFLADTEPSYLEKLRGSMSTWAWDRRVEETKPPEGSDGKEWIFYEIARKVEPAPRYNFHGDIYVLIDGGSGSATDQYANDIKRTGYATLVGQSTNGSIGGYFVPVTVRLPASGMIFLLQTDLFLNPDGSINELVGTRPDVELPSCDLPQSVTREDLLKDEWIKKVMAGLPGDRRAEPR